MSNYSPITGEKERKDYVQSIWDELFKGLEETYFSKHGISWTIKKGTSPRSMYGVKNEIQLSKDKKRLSVTVDVYPWLWSDGSMWIEYEFKSASRLAIPSARVTPRKKGYLWTSGITGIDFYKKTDIMNRYVKIMNLTAADVGLFDNILSAVERLL